MYKYSMGSRLVLSILLLFFSGYSVADSSCGGAVNCASGNLGAMSTTDNQVGVQSNPSSTASANLNSADSTGFKAKTPAKLNVSGQEAGARGKNVSKLNQSIGKKTKFENQFQKFVAQSVGHILPMYGYNLFDQAPDTFAPVEDIPVTPDYTIGPGDELRLHVWGEVEADTSMVVDRNGLIDIPKVGPISVVGIRYQDLQAHLKAAISKVFRNFDLDVSLGKLRSIQVFVVGQAARPGNYTISSLSTLVNALFASGGPSAEGSMRHIQLKRGGHVVTDFDMYDLLLKGDKSKDVPLQSGDVIYIPTIGPMAAITGSVNSPAIYELKDKETLSNLFDMAGGLTNTAAGKMVSVERIENRSIRKVEEFPLSQGGIGKMIHDGDLITVYAISPRFDNAITLRGNIVDPGRHPWHDGMRVSDMIPDKSNLIINSYWLTQNQSANKSVAGQNNLRNDVKHSLAEVNWEYAVIERLNPHDLTTSLIPFNLKKAVIDHDPQQNLLLQPGDVITIFSKDDIQVPVAQRTKYIMLEGEVAHPGIYQALPEETLRQLVERVGGVTPQAYLFGSEFDRISTQKMQQKRLDEFSDKLEADIQRNASKATSAALTPDEAKAAQTQAALQQSLLAKTRQLKATGRIVLQLPENNPQVKDLPDITLDDGDHFTVPATPSTVSVMGSVYNPNAFLYQKKLSVGDYLAESGGATQDADPKDVYVVRADGMVFSKRQGNGYFSRFTGRKALPGDTIVVPENLKQSQGLKTWVDYSQIFFNSALSIASLKVLGVI